MIHWIAEVGSAHKGDESLAYEYIRAYSEAGATAVKFQFGWTKDAQQRFGLVYNPARYIDHFAPRLSEWCDYFGVLLEASIWSQEGLETAEDCRIHIYKIGKKMYEMDGEFAYKVAQDHPTFTTGVDVFTVGEYPTYPNHFSMPTKFLQPMIGYSDHTHGIEACLLAVARGATYVEKHCALDKTDLITKDTPFSATPQEFEQMVKIGNGMWRLLHAKT